MRKKCSKRVFVIAIGEREYHSWLLYSTSPYATIAKSLATRFESAESAMLVILKWYPGRADVTVKELTQ
jgi:hypothetical protein